MERVTSPHRGKVRMKVYEIMDAKARPGPGTASVLNKEELGRSDSQCHVHSISLCPRFLSRPKIFFFFSTFLEMSLRKIILPVDTLETNNMTKQIRIRSLKPKAWPQPTFAEDLWIQNPSPAGGPYKPPLASPHTSSGKPGFAALKALSFRFNLSCIHFPKLDGICNVLKYAEGN